MAKYVFLNIPAYGHVNPTLPVVKELVRRGEEVVYFLTEDFRAAVEATGAIFRSYQPFGKPSEPSAQTNAALVPTENKKPDGAFEMLARVRAEQPDYIIYDAMHMWARTIAQALHVPAILSCPMFVANDHFNPLKDHFNLLDGTVALPSPVPPAELERIQAEVAEVCKKYDLPPFDMRNFYNNAAALNIVFVAPDFHPARETFDERFVFVGPSLLEQGDDTVKQSDGGPTLYISLGTVFNDRPDFFNLCFDAFGSYPWQVILAYGKRVDKAILGNAPENFQMAPYVKQFEVLPRTSVFVTHGGMGSVMESLYYGVPMVVVPQQEEQERNAQRIVELGLGLALDQKELTTKALRAAVECVHSDPAFYERAQAMKQTVRAAGGYQHAADAIRDFAHKHVLAAHS